MRIISKIKDFYDYISYELSDKDDDIVFDRRNSIIITKNDIASFLNFYEKDNNYYYPVSHNLIFQVGYLFYLIEIYDIEYKDVIYCGVKTKKFSNYKMKIIDKWRNYNNKALMKFYKEYRSYIYKTDEQYINYLKNCHKFDKEMELAPYEDKTLILNETGLASIIDPKEIYLALDEYFSSLITDNEKTESVGITNNEKIINHGFDKKSSFRSIK